MTPQPSEQPRTAAAILIDALAEDERAWLLAEARELRPDDPGDTVPGRILERWETARSLTAAQRYLAPMTQPRTAAGRALVDTPLHTAGIGSDRDDDRLLAAVLAIEAQAMLRQIDDLARAIDGACPFCEGKRRVLMNEEEVTPQEGGSEPYHYNCTSDLHAEQLAEHVYARLAAAPDPVASRLWAERNHYLAGCACAESPWCAPHGWAGTVEPDDHSICADHPHVDPEGRADIPDALKRLEPAPDPVASPLDVARATVERIRERLADNHNTLGAEVYRLDQIYDILEEFGA